MEDQVMQTTTETTQAESAPAVEVTKDVASTPAGAQTTSGQAPEVETPFVPDWKYKFNGQEKEVDEFYRPIVKNAEQLKKIKDTIQRSEALDEWKEKTKKFETQLGEYTPTIETVQKLQDLYQQGQHERVLEAIGYTDDMIFKIAQQKLERQQMPADQRKLIEDSQRVTLEKEQLMAQNQMYRSQVLEAQSVAVDHQIGVELGKAEYQGMKDAYEKANGSGSFRQLVVDRGYQLSELSGKTVPPSEVVAMLAKEFAPFITTPAHPAEAGGTVQVAAKPKVIPHVGKGGGSPAKTAITSIAQLRKLSQQRG